MLIRIVILKPFWIVEDILISLNCLGALKKIENVEDRVYAHLYKYKWFRG